MYAGKLQSLALMAAFLCIPSAPAHAQRVTPNISYSPNQTADLYTPTGTGPFPVILYIHGGSWRSGSKSDFHKLATDLAAKGYLGFSIDYDLHPHSWPTSLNQSLDAVRFLRAHAAEYHLDPNRILVLGTSAGGELAALVALTPNAHISAAILLNGVYDLSSDAHVIVRYLGARCVQDPAVCKAASPIQQLHAGAPPFFVGHGTADHTVPYADAQTFIAALQQAHVPVTPFVAQNGPHSYWSKSAFYAPNLAAIEAFLKQLPAATP
jgi:acetyl esterase/lipase